MTDTNVATPPAAEDVEIFSQPVVDWAANVKAVNDFIAAEKSVDWDQERCGEAFFAEGVKNNEMAHPSVLIGPWKGPVGVAASVAFGNPQRGHTPMMAVRRPNVRAPIFTVVANEVTIDGVKKACKVGGPLQRAAADAVTHCIGMGILPKEKSKQRKLAILFQGFVHWAAESDEKVYWWNYRAMVDCLVRAVTFTPTTEEILNDIEGHPYCQVKTATLPSDVKGVENPS